ncbi:hypothetical protein [Neisseria weaveri]|uniref:Uncharacterized protein n=1 Tax=Neisseria weaveri TaxID=28091 RepID=A0A3S4ZJS7_9NEIS|nr:hypothetical protein [Neisseria weaveri]EGV38436.1 hypothetical protein l11_04590 [Neisseria weaveri LMG 5135]VEJ50023.1 Uncharacterised protein [Neisseria weaveri]
MDIKNSDDKAELSTEKSATIDIELRADSGYRCSLLNQRISPKQWKYISEILHRKDL